MLTMSYADSTPCASKAQSTDWKNPRSPPTTRQEYHSRLPAPTIHKQNAAQKPSPNLRVIQQVEQHARQPQTQQPQVGILTSPKPCLSKMQHRLSSTARRPASGKPTPSHRPKYKPRTPTGAKGPRQPATRIHLQ